MDYMWENKNRRKKRQKNAYQKKIDCKKKWLKKDGDYVSCLDSSWIMEM